jgi:hypothetical protein
MIILKFSLTGKEYFDFNYFTAWASPEKKGYRFRYYLRIIALYSLIALIYVVANNDHDPGIDFLVFGAIGLIYISLIPFLIRKSVQKRVDQILNDPANAHVLDQSEIILSETSIIDRDKVTETRYEWDAIVRKAEAFDCFYLYTNSYHAIVIPMRVLTSTGTLQEVLDLINTKLPISAEFPQGTEA